MVKYPLVQETSINTSEELSIHRQQRNSPKYKGIYTTASDPKIELLR